jgi:hypothetical protein
VWELSVAPEARICGTGKGKNTIFSTFYLPSPHLEPEMEMTQEELFIRFDFPDYWVFGAYYAPKPKKLSSKLWA